jgi:hypothetical protein
MMATPSVSKNLKVSREDAEANPNDTTTAHTVSPNKHGHLQYLLGSCLKCVTTSESYLD